MLLVSCVCLPVASLVLSGCKPAGDKKDSNADKPSSPTTSGQPSRATEVATKLEAIRTTGYPVTLAELETWQPTPPAAENAALKFAEAFVALGSAPPTTIRLPQRTERLPADTKAAITAVMTQTKTAREGLHQAATLNQSKYPVNWQEGYNAKMPHLASVKGALTVLRLESAILLENNRSDMAVTSVVTMVRLARSLEREPSLISQLVRIASLQLAVSAAERLVNQRNLVAPQLAALQDAFREPNQSESFTAAMVGERCSGINLFQGTPETAAKIINNAAGADSSPGDLAGLKTAWKNKEADFLFFLEIMEGYVEASKSSPPASLEMVKTLGARVQQARGRPPEEAPVVSALLLSPYESSAVKFAENAARLRATQAVVAIERYRAANAGRLPDSLDKLVPAQLPTALTDPFDGKPLRYKRLAKGYVVYSIGSDGQDDGGKEKPPGTQTAKGFDLTFTVER
jgi:hypothetical protein